MAVAPQPDNDLPDDRPDRDRDAGRPGRPGDDRPVRPARRPGRRRTDPAPGGAAAARETQTVARPLTPPIPGVGGVRVRGGTPCSSSS